MYTSMEELQETCLQCEQCPLAKGRTNPVFGIGNPYADIMFIGEGPGQQEDLLGEPFVGPSGKLLDKYLQAIGLSRQENVYIANIVKCRPPGNRDPKEEEQDTCLPWLREQVRLSRPKIIVCLGRIAAKKLISPEFRVTKEHGNFVSRGNTLMMGTFHPAALLRNPQNKPLAFDDFLRLREKAEELGIL